MQPRLKKVRFGLQFPQPIVAVTGTSPPRLGGATHNFRAMPAIFCTWLRHEPGGRTPPKLQKERKLLSRNAKQHWHGYG